MTKEELDHKERGLQDNLNEGLLMVNKKITVNQAIKVISMWESSAFIDLLEIKDHDGYRHAQQQGFIQALTSVKMLLCGHLQQAVTDTDTQHYREGFKAGEKAAYNAIEEMNSREEMEEQEHIHYDEGK
jgi:hypothetical protein